MAEWVYWLPPINAALNGTAAVLLVVAYVLIRQGKYLAHAATVIGALVMSTAFLASYLLYHSMVGERSSRFPAGTIRPIYLAILLTHTVLAMVIVPMVLATLWRAYRRDWVRHRRLSRWTLPLWLYVAVTGVAVYVMLYVWRW